MKPTEAVMIKRIGGSMVRPLSGPYGEVCDGIEISSANKFRDFH